MGYLLTTTCMVYAHYIALINIFLKYLYDVTLHMILGAPVVHILHIGVVYGSRSVYLGYRLCIQIILGSCMVLDLYTWLIRVFSFTSTFVYILPVLLGYSLRCLLTVYILLKMFIVKVTQ